MTVPALTSIQTADLSKTTGATRQSSNAAPANFADQLGLSLSKRGQAGGNEQLTGKDKTLAVAAKGSQQADSLVLQQTTARQHGVVAANQQETRGSQAISSGNLYQMGNTDKSTDVLNKALDMISQFLNQPELKSGEYFFLSAAAYVQIQKMREQGISMDNVDMSSFFLAIAKEAEAYVENATGTRPNLQQRAQEWLKGGCVSVAATA